MIRTPMTRGRVLEIVKWGVYAKPRIKTGEHVEAYRLLGTDGYRFTLEELSWLADAGAEAEGAVQGSMF